MQRITSLLRETRRKTVFGRYPENRTLLNCLIRAARSTRLADTVWSRVQDSNLYRAPYKNAMLTITSTLDVLVRLPRFELGTDPWHGPVLPIATTIALFGCAGRSRTFKHLLQRQAALPVCVPRNVWRIVRGSNSHALLGPPVFKTEADAIHRLDYPR
jgi:hypothetical protein